MVRHKGEADVSTAAAGAALVASVLGQLSEGEAPPRLRPALEALQRLIHDWQQAYHNVEGQLRLAMRAHEEHARLLDLQRREIEQLRARVYEAERRALLAEAAAGAGGRPDGGLG
jgi:hypothetical protein